jgi:alpha-L-arabinofuranosidase
MKEAKIFICIISLLLLGGTMPVLASDAFHITYQQENVAVADGVLTGDLIVNIVNISGQDAKDVAVSIPGPNNVTYDNHQALVGDVADGHMAGATAAINAPEEMQTGEAADEVVWNVEFTNSLGERQTVAVTGSKIQ